MNNREEQIEALSKAIDWLISCRADLAIGTPFTSNKLDEAMRHTGRAFSLLWDIRYQEKGQRL